MLKVTQQVQWQEIRKFPFNGSFLTARQVIGSEFGFLFYLFLTVLGLLSCMQTFSSCNEQGLFFIVVCRLLIVMASLVAEYRLWVNGLQQLQLGGSIVVAHALQLFHNMWNLPRPGVRPVSPALSGRFLSTVPPGKSLLIFSQPYRAAVCGILVPQTGIRPFPPVVQAQSLNHQTTMEVLGSEF